MKNEFSVNAKLSYIALLAVNGLVGGHSDYKFLILEALKGNESKNKIIKMIFSSLKKLNKNDEEILKIVDFIVSEDGVGIKHRIRNLATSNGQIVFVDENIHSPYEYINIAKKAIKLQEISEAKKDKFWIEGKIGGGTVEFNESCLKGLVFVSNDSYKVVNEKILKDSIIERMNTKLSNTKDIKEIALAYFVECYDKWCQFAYTYNGDFGEDSSSDDVENTSPSIAIYYGPPGTGKTTKAKVESLSNVKTNNRKIVQIHPSYSYEDLVEGIKPITFFDGEIKYDVCDGPIKIMNYKASGNNVKLLCCITSRGVHLPTGTKSKYGFERVHIIDNRNGQSYFEKEFPVDDNDFIEFNDYPGFDETIKSGEKKFTKLSIRDISWGSDHYGVILDEINRGNVASILGELVFALSEVHADPGDERAVNLQYSNEPFIWSKKLHLIATMNTADTTTDKIDQAIKRRFEFISVDPWTNDLDKGAESNWRKSKLSILDKKGLNIVDFCKNEARISGGYQPWIFLDLINSALLSKETQNSYHLIQVQEKLIGHSYLLKYVRRIAECHFLGDEYHYSDVLKKIFENEIYPSLLSIFNSNSDNLIQFLEKLSKQSDFPKDIVNDLLNKQNFYTLKKAVGDD